MSDATTPSTEVTTPATTVAEVKTPKAPKVTRYIVHVDANGVELNREVKGKGRPPRGAVQNAEGNFIVSPITSPTRFIPDYITLDANGAVTSRVAKGRGRPKPDFVKQTSGQYEGHWIKVEAVKADAAPTTVVATDTAIAAVKV